jgi:hypothetical protein
MNACKRTVLAAAMLVITSMPLCLFMYYKVQQLVVRHEMMEKLEHSNLITIEIPSSSVKWYEEEKEIIVQGRMFDVKSYEEVPGTINIKFTGLFDDAETEIEDKVKNLLQQEEKKDGGKKLLVQAVWIFSSPLPGSPELASITYEIETAFKSYTLGSIPLADLSIPSPPPKA